ncbi:MAG: hypothetical protein HS129_04905 [Leptospiraceae bacterium]|nr:hypothetical protein [Leptospiraceae bacterium]
MAKRYLTGGSNPFEVSPGPSVFNPNPPDDLIERQGESFIWLRALPNPDVTREDRMSLAGERQTIYRIDKTRRLPLETLQNQDMDGGLLYTRFGPISKIRSLVVFRNEDFGGNIPLEVLKFSGNTIEIRPNPEFEDYMQVDCDYEVKAMQLLDFREIQLQSDGKYLDLGIYPDIIVKVLSVWRKESNGMFIELKDCYTDYKNVILPTISEKGRRFNVSVLTYSPIKVGYRSINSRDKRLADKNFDIQAGDLDAVVGSNINLSKGDILISTLSIANETEIVRRNKDGLFPVKYTPLREIYSVNSLERSFDDTEYSILNYRFIKIESDDIPDNLTVVYGYNPKFVVIPETTISALSKKNQPRKWVLRLSQTTIDIGTLFESVLNSSDFEKSKIVIQPAVNTKKIYWGYAGATITDIEIVGLQNSDNRETTSGDYFFGVSPGLNYLWICVPSSFSPITGIFDLLNNFELFSDFNGFIQIPILNEFSVIENYRCYRSTYQTSAGGWVIRLT